MDTSEKTPPGWLEILAESEADLAAGNVLPASVVHQDLRDSITRMKAKAAVFPRKIPAAG
jgi:hypothetical protein